AARADPAVTSNGRAFNTLSHCRAWYGTCAIHWPDHRGGTMQRSILAFAIAAAILAMGAPVATGQHAAGSARTVAPKRAAKPAPSPVQQELQRNLVLADGLRNRLPSGTDLNAAAAGFR